MTTYKQLKPQCWHHYLLTQLPDMVQGTDTRTESLIKNIFIYISLLQKKLKTYPISVYRHNMWFDNVTMNFITFKLQ